MNHNLFNQARLATRMKKKGLEEPLHVDARGEIHRFDIKGVKFNGLFTKAGALRSGDMHPHTQFNIVLSGELEITLRQGKKDIVVRKKPGKLIIIPPNVPHLYRSITDSIILEWWDGPFEVAYFEPYRRLVEKQFK